MEKWLDYEFETSTVKTPEFKSFARDFKKYIKNNIPAGAELVKFNAGHFYVSGFIRMGEKFVYFMSSDVRFFPNEWYTKLLIRTAKSETDYSGGTNMFTALPDFSKNVQNLA